MKRYSCVVCALLLVLVVAVAWAQMPRTLSYQGILMDTNKQPVADGQYSLTFRLYDPTNTVVWTEVQPLVSVNGGLFNVVMGTVTPLSIYFDKAYSLGIQVGSDPEMVPRTPLTCAAYAIRADDADKVLGFAASLTPEANKLLPLDASGKFPASVMPGSSVTGDFIKKNTPDTSRATSASPLVLVSNLGDGNGLDARSANGAGMAGRSTIGDGVTGWTGASDKSGIFGSCTDGIGVKGRSENNDGTVGWTGSSGKSGIYGHTSTSGAFGVSGIASTGGIGVHGYNNASGYGASLGTDDHGLTVQGLARFALSSGQISVSTPGGWPGIIGLSTNGHRRDVVVWDDGMSFEVSTTSSAPTAGKGITIRESGYVGVGTTTPAEELDVIGTVRCKDLTLTGGSDIAEPFNVRMQESVKAGMVMSIDPKEPGKLRVACKEYDCSVAGVISGAGGIKSGVLMSQAGSVADGEYPVALTGRVYCLADAANTPINPGDLLTTSDIPGHAMKVIDSAKAQGAILGKAMSALDHGRGLVLILVTLQ